MAGTDCLDPLLYISIPAADLADLLAVDNAATAGAKVPERLAALLDPGTAGEDDSKPAVVRITAADLNWIRDHIGKESKGALYRLLCSSSQLELPQLRQPARSPELEARCQKLRRQQAEREYRRMTANIRKDPEVKELSIAAQLREVNSYLVLILQFLVSVFASFAFGYLAPYYLYGQTEVGPRLLIGVLCGFVAGVADLYFVIRQMLDDDGIRLAKKLT